MNQIDDLIRGMCECEITNHESMVGVQWVDLEMGLGLGLGLSLNLGNLIQQKEEEFFLCNDMYIEAAPLKKQKVKENTMSFEDYLKGFNVEKRKERSVPLHSGDINFFERVKEDFLKYKKE
jgi:hypothetical protein